MEDKEKLKSFEGLPVKERPLMAEGEFKTYLEDNRPEGMVLHLLDYSSVKRFKSVRRAIRKGLVTPEGFIVPKRPFNNKRNTCKRKNKNSRAKNELKKFIYGRLTAKQN